MTKAFFRIVHNSTNTRENQNTQHFTMLPAYSAYMQLLHVSIPQGYFMHRISVSIPQVLTLSFHRKPFLSRHDLQNNWRRQNPKLGIYFQTIYLTEIITKWPDKSYHTTGIWCESPTVQTIWNRLKNRITDRTFMKFQHGGSRAKCNLLLPASQEYGRIQHSDRQLNSDIKTAAPANFWPQHSRRHRRHTSSSTSSSSSPANPRRSLPHKQEKGGGRERRRPHMLTVPKRLTSHGYFAPNPDSKSRSRETNYFNYYFLTKQGNISFDFGRILIQQR